LPKCCPTELGLCWTQVDTGNRSLLTKAGKTLVARHMLNWIGPMLARIGLFALCIACCFFSKPAHADTAAFSCDVPSNGPISAIQPPGACAGFRVRALGDRPELVVKFGFNVSGMMLASRDGRTVVAITSYLFGGVAGNGDVFEIRRKGKRKNPKVVFVYRDGKQVASHRINTLIARRHLLEQSISHVNLVDGLPWLIDGDSFTLNTTSYESIRFSARTGAIENKTDVDLWKNCDEIARGVLDTKNPRIEYLVKANRSLKTPLPVKLAKGLADRLPNYVMGSICLKRSGTEYIVTRTSHSTM
jgi:hypothetical protein